MPMPIAGGPFNHPLPSSHSTVLERTHLNMAQLPPKIPSMASTCPDFCLQFVPTANVLPAQSAALPPPSWVLDEFLDFSTTRRGMHRRSASDSVAFLEAPSLIMEECRLGNVIPTSCGNSRHPLQQSEFDKFDDEQFLSMFTDDDETSNNAAARNTTVAVTNNDPGVAASTCSNPSTPSEHDSIDDEREVVVGKEEQSQLEEHEGPVTTPPTYSSSARCGDGPIDPRRVKRILANRQSAQRSRVRKLQYISELEHSVTSLQAEVSVLSPRVAFLDRQRLVLNVDNSALKQRIAALAQDKIFKEAHQEALRREIDRLTQVYHQQSLKKMQSELPLQNSVVADPTTASEKEQPLLQV